jgi:D-alanyl-D-alanine endopeptidase (penicillin-binding protein 7)
VAVVWAPKSGSAKAIEAANLNPDPAYDPPFMIDLSNLEKPRLRSQAAVVYNPETHEILWELNGYKQRSIASITKVMTAIVFLEQLPDLDAEVVVSVRDSRRANTTYLRRGERVSLRHVLHLALLGSDNVAARVLARVSPWGSIGFIEQMNTKAELLGLHSTDFVDPSGLYVDNRSTAYDLARLITYASRNNEIASIMRKKSHQVLTSRRRFTVRNTNRLLSGSLTVSAGKTGYIDASGYCLAAVVHIDGRDPMAVVVLGASSNQRRFSEASRLANWVSQNRDSLISESARFN